MACRHWWQKAACSMSDHYRRANLNDIEPMFKLVTEAKQELETAIKNKK